MTFRGGSKVLEKITQEQNIWALKLVIPQGEKFYSVHINWGFLTLFFFFKFLK